MRKDSKLLRTPEKRVLMRRTRKSSPVAIETQERQDSGQQNATQSFLPTIMTRLCPFYPKTRMKEKQIKGSIDTKNDWGECKLKGWYLSLYDEEIMMCLLHLMTIQKTGRTVRTTYHEICKVLGKSANNSAYDSIKNSINKLCFSGYWIEDKKGKSWEGSTFLRAEKKKEEGKIIINISPAFLKIYKDTGATYYELEERKKLREMNRP